MLSSTNLSQHEVLNAHKITMLQKCDVLKLSNGAYILFINVKIPTFVDILLFLCRVHFMLTLVEHEHEKQLYLRDLILFK